MSDLYTDAKLDGKISVDGQDLFEKGIEVTEIRRKIRMVLQRANSFPKSIMTALNKLYRKLFKMVIYNEVRKDLKAGDKVVRRTAEETMYCKNSSYETRSNFDGRIMFGPQPYKSYN